MLLARGDVNQCLNEFIETVLLNQIQRKIVIFIDEIDNVLGLKFSTDEFFALIRHCYENRAMKPAYRRLSFALLGVASPSDLIQDKHYSTPFNIGRAIELQGFKEVDRLLHRIGIHLGDIYFRDNDVLGTGVPCKHNLN